MASADGVEGQEGVDGAVTDGGEGESARHGDGVPADRAESGLRAGSGCGHRDGDRQREREQDDREDGDGGEGERHPAEPAQAERHRGCDRDGQRRGEGVEAERLAAEKRAPPWVRLPPRATTWKGRSVLREIDARWMTPDIA